MAPSSNNSEQDCSNICLVGRGRLNNCLPLIIEPILDSYMEIVQSLLTKMGIFHKPQIKALTTLFATILIACGKVNFTNLSRYSERTERTYRRQFKKQFDFAQFNAEVIKAATPENQLMIAVMDCSFIAKSGKMLNSLPG
jgi:hypothetical protein